jgi:uncharacterized membrane protein YeaQ/YmgE (transglycosylase-associated protein family)
MMLILSLVWLAIGLLIGALANAARLRLPLWGRRGWLLMPGIGMLAALLGGWLGALLLSRYFGTATALWVAVAVVVAAPWVVRVFSALKGASSGRQSTGRGLMTFNDRNR